MANEIQERLKELGIEIPEAPKPAAVYVPAKRTGNLVYTSGQDCKKNGVLVHSGKIGKDLTVEQGYEAARQTMINCLAVLQQEIGDLNKVKQFVIILVIVSSASDFVEYPY